MDWADLIRRVKGIGMGNAAKLSAQGLRVNGAAFQTQEAQSPQEAPGKSPRSN